MKTVFITVCHMPGTGRIPRAYSTFALAKKHCEAVSDGPHEWLSTLDDETPMRSLVTRFTEMSIHKAPIDWGC